MVHADKHGRYAVVPRVHEVRRRHRDEDRVTFPACPHRGNLCGKLARLCADCGAFLREPDLNDWALRRRLHPQPDRRRWDVRDDAGRFQQAAPLREAVPPSKEREDHP